MLTLGSTLWMFAMLAGGVVDLEVRRRPRVAIVPTGTELIEPGEPLDHPAVFH